MRVFAALALLALSCSRSSQDAQLLNERNAHQAQLWVTDMGFDQASVRCRLSDNCACGSDASLCDVVHGPKESRKTLTIMCEENHCRIYRSER